MLGMTFENLKTVGVLAGLRGMENGRLVLIFSVLMMGALRRAIHGDDGGDVLGIGRGGVGDCSGQGDDGDDGSDVLGIGRGAVGDCSGHGDDGDEGNS